MPPVNWDQPSTGIVNDVQSALILTNHTGGALSANSDGVAISAKSSANEAVIAGTTDTLTGRFTSDQFIALFGFAPNGVGVIAANQAGNAAIAGSSLTDPAVPNVQQNPDGIGVLGVSDRFDAVGAAGLVLGPRSVGVLGHADSGFGVQGVGTDGGVQGIASVGPGVSGMTTSSTGTGVRGEGIAGPGVDGYSSAGPGVRALSDQAQGVFAEAKAANAAAVFGVNDDPNGIGVDGFSQNGTAVRGFTTNGTALYADAMTGRAVDASNFSLEEPAVWASNAAGTAVEAASLVGTGVSVVGNPGVSAGCVAGPDGSDPAAGTAVFGASLGGAGVCGMTVTGTGVVGIGNAIAGAWAGVFQGNVLIEGLLIKFASWFSIDHPLDPERRVLNHAAVEAPEYKTFYDGVVVLDTRGRARVALPRWFEPLNGEFRYQLTPLGSAAPGLYVAEEVKEGSFLIAGGSPRQKVCWQLTGVRHDAWAIQNPLVVEQSRQVARPRMASPRLADLEKQADALKERASELKTIAVERERAVRTRLHPSPVPTRGVPQPAPGTKPRRIAEQMMATVRRLMTPRTPVG